MPAPGPKIAPANGNLGNFTIVGNSGVPSMHAGLLPNGQVALLDKVENYTGLMLSNGRFAYAAEWSPRSRESVPLSVKSNPFCSGGGFMADGTLLSVGGNGPIPTIDSTVSDRFKGIRFLKRSVTDSNYNGNNWIESNVTLSSARWYPTAQILSDGTYFVVSGSLNGLDPTNKANNNPTYEVLSRNGTPTGVSTQMSILVRNQPYHMYPFVHLLSDGTLFVFTSKSSEIFSVSKNTTIKRFNDLPGDYRTYPNTGTSVMLPLTFANNWNPDIIICGGGAYQDITSPTDPSCGRIQPFSDAPTWEMDAMPEGRGMVEGILLPDGTVIFLNGANQGSQGFGLATNPTTTALLYNPSANLGSRWSTLATSTIPRLYHSVALLLIDGTILISGSNPNEQPVLKANAQNPFPTEFRQEIFTPPYLSGTNSARRPANVRLSTLNITYGTPSAFFVNFDLPQGDNDTQYEVTGTKIVLYHGGFVTHSLHMGQRMLTLDFEGWIPEAKNQSLRVIGPPNGNVAPPGPYVVFVVVEGVPAIGQFVMVG
jgi:hypothetical protein